MGYTSSVAIRCKRGAYDKLIEACVNSQFDPDYTYYNDKLEEYTLQWNWIKWYDDDYKVKAITNTMDALDDLSNCTAHDPSYSYCYLRVGEDMGDRDYRYNDGVTDIDAGIQFDITSEDRLIAVFGDYTHEDVRKEEKKRRTTHTFVDHYNIEHKKEFSADQMNAIEWFMAMFYDERVGDVRCKWT